MMKPFTIAFTRLLIVGAMIATACTPARKAQKYSYLLKNRPLATTSTPTPTPTPRPRPTTTPTKSLPETTPKRTENRRKPTGNRVVHKAVSTAKSYLGTPYRYGGTTRKGMDCSGLIYTSYMAADKRIPRTSSQQARAGRRISEKHVQPGDLLFFSAYKSGKVTHVGMVTTVKGKDIEFIHASTSKGVRIDRLHDAYWYPRFVKAVKLD